MAALAGAIMIQAKDSYRSALPGVWLVVVVALLVAADGVDAQGEALAASCQPHQRRLAVCHAPSAVSSSGRERCNSLCQYGHSWMPGP